jgi:glycosyltransferase involved in cell wall biosynthesis
MRIAIDARELCGRTTGAGRYLSEVLTAWNALPAAASHQLILCAPEAIDRSAWPSLDITTAHTPGAGTLWEQFALPRLLADVNADLLWAPAYTGPIRSRVPMVLAIHDVSFAAHPEWFSWREGLRRRIVTRAAAGRAIRVLTISDFSKEEIVRHLRIDENKIEVIYLGVRALASPVASAATAAAPAPASGPRVLYVGSIFNRRHVPELIDGFSRVALRHPALQLDIVGDNRTHPRIDLDQVVAQSRASERIRVRSYVTEAELAALYQSASALVFLSDYEGFGFTPLEALSAGVPVIVLDTPVAREIYGPAAVYVAAPEPALVESALERLLLDAAERTRLLDAASTILPRYQWDECAKRTLKTLVAVNHER